MGVSGLGSLFCSDSGSLERVIPLFLCDLNLSCSFKYAIWIDFGMV